MKKKPPETETERTERIARIEREIDEWLVDERAAAEARWAGTGYKLDGRQHR